MASPTNSLISGLAGKLGISGRRKYDVTPTPPQFAGMTLKEKLCSRALDFRRIDREQRLRRNTVWYMMSLYYQGYQNIELNPAGNTFDVYEREDFYVENQFRKHVDTVKNMLNKMEPEVLARPGSDSPADIACARVADSVLSSMRDNLGYDKLRDQKNLYKCLYGNAFIFCDYVVDKKFGTVVSPKYDYNEVPGPDGEPILSKVVAGYQTRNKGSEIAVICSPLEIHIRSDIKGGIENVPYLQWITRQDLETINYVYPGLNMVGGLSATEQDLAQQYIETISLLPGNILGDSPAYNRSLKAEKAELVRTWLQPSTFRGDKELLSNFPTGVHVVTVNGTVVDFYEECLTDRWTHEVLIPVPHSLIGDGLYDAILVQDQINEMNSLFIQHLRYSTVGHKLYDSEMLDSKDIVNDPRNGWIPVKRRLEGSLNDAVRELPPTQISQDIPAWLQHEHEIMQDMTSAYDPATGKGIGANTPYSQSVFLNEKAQGRWAGTTAYNSPALVQFHRQLLQIARDNWIDPRRRSFQKQTGEWSFEQFSRADLQGQVEIILTNTDMKPQSRAEQIQGLTMLTTLAPLLPAMPPRQKLRIEEMLGLPPDANPTSNQISRAYRMIDRISQGMVVTPTVLVDDANIQVPVFQDYLLSENGETLAEQNPQAWANIHLYMLTLMQMGMMQQNSPAAQHMGPPPNQPPVKGTAPQGQPPKPAGGQPGQQGGGPQGGPGSPVQPNAQSPSQPAPPVAAPAPLMR